jgi:hypothetical protein
MSESAARVAIVQVVPVLPPPMEGLGGYALALGEALASRHGIASTYLVCAPDWQKNTAASDEVHRVDRRGAREIVSSLGELAGAQGGQAPAVVLHYVNYGYQKRGCPTWLIRGLGRWRGAHPEARLVTVFHEVWALGPPWRSSFWVFPVQWALARRALALSDSAITSLACYVGRLGGDGAARKVTVMPVFSTVGEPRSVARLAGRDKAVVVFGGAGTRDRAYSLYRRQLEACCTRLEAEVVFDVGPSLDSLPERVACARVQPLGMRAPGEVSTLLSRCLAGFAAYPPHLLGKSTVFAAYAAHGVLPVIAWNWTADGDEVRRGVHYWCSKDPLGRDTSPQAIASEATAWYDGHTVAVHAEWYRGALRK